MKLPVVKRKETGRAVAPFENYLVNLQNTMDRLFSEFWRGVPTLSTQSLFDQTFTGGWWPKADISETDKEFRVKLNVPNVDPSKINIEVDANTLTVSGATEKEEKEEGENWYRIERESGEFRRVFDLPSGCDINNISAQSKHGTLLITIPKKPEAQKKKIEVKTES